MNKDVLNIVNQKFINKKLNSDISSLLLKKHFNLSVDIKELIEQIESKKRCLKKLPTWFNTQNIYYPNKLNIEQTSSEKTAEYKSKLITGNSLIDLTGGFGVDCFYFAKQFKKVIHCEINQNLSDIVEHNYKQLGIENIDCLNVDGIEYLKQTQQTFSCIYIDPSRRHDSKGKVFFLADCLPNVPEHLNVTFEHSNKILVKTSPLLDISIGLSELKFVKQIHIIAVNNEVKELLWLLEKGFEDDIEVSTINIKQNSQEAFNFNLNQESIAQATYSEPLSYLYEPNTAILKSGAFNLVSQQLKVHKLHKNSHLYTSNNLVEFPGRCFKIEKTLPYNKKLLQKENIIKANVTTRNFPESVAQIRKKLKIKEGGNNYLFFTTNMNNERIFILCSKLS